VEGCSRICASASPLHYGALFERQHCADGRRRTQKHLPQILGSEIARDFKPKPRVYLSAAEALGLKPEEVMMVAAHSDDLRSAASNGLRTAHVARPQESPTGEAGPRGTVDFAARDFSDLADKIAS
jgi:2-haloacid dehalogenase